MKLEPESRKVFAGAGRPEASPEDTIDPRAEEDLGASARWYEEHVGTGMGDRILAAFDAAVVIVADAPNRWPLAPHVSPALGVHRYLLKKFPYGLLYRLISDDQLEIVAFAHQKRKPGYWIERLRKPPR